MGKVKTERKINRKSETLPEAKEEKVSKPKVTPNREKRKSKVKKEKQLTIGPKLRLEPWITPKKNENKQCIDIEKDKRLVVSLNENEIQKFCLEEALSYGDLGTNIIDNNEPRSESSMLNISPADENIICETEDNIQSSTKNDIEEDDDLDSFVYKKPRKRRRVKKSIWWNYRELRDLATGFQSHGFSDLKKVADCVKTKSENDIREYMKPRCREARKEITNVDPNPEKHRGRPVNHWTTVCSEYLEQWPNVRKWRRLAYEQMLLYTRSKDYSRPVISSLCQKFYEEEEEPSDPEVINVKLIYKYMMDCMSGHIPPQLPPKESALVMDMLREVRLMPILYDFEEERKFLQEFKVATTFKPFEIKDEFKKRYKKRPDDEVCGPHTVSVPEEVFLDLSRHKRLLQSFNPLVNPVWFLQKEQEYLEKYFNESAYLF